MPYTIKGYTLNYDGGLSSTLTVRKKLTELEKQFDNLNLTEGSGWHLDASMLTSIYTNGQSISNWPDLSTSEEDAIQNPFSGWGLPVLAENYANGLSTVRFNHGAGLIVINNPMVGSPAGTFYMVAQWDEDGYFYFPFRGFGNTNMINEWMWFPFNEQGAHLFYGTDSIKIWPMTGAHKTRTKSSLFIMEIVTAPGKFEVWFDGSIVYSNTSNNVYWLTNSGNYEIQIGRTNPAQGGSTYWFEGWIGEALMYPYELSDDERTLRRLYLASKWGITA